MPKMGQLKKTLFEELKETNRKIESIEQGFWNIEPILMERKCLLQHKEFIQKLIDICVDRNKF